MSCNVTITRARHAWPEPSGFTIERPNGISEYTFLHFFESVEILVQDEVILAPPDSCIFYNVGTPQWFRTAQSLQHDWMHMVGAVPESLAAVGLRLDTLYVPPSGRFITELMQQIESEVLSHASHYAEMEQLKYQELLIRFARSLDGQAAPVVGRGENGAPTEINLRAVRSQMFSQLGYPWTVQELAARAYLSPSRFFAVYKAMFHISPMDDLIRARIDTAKDRLIDTGLPVHSLAENLGYRNVTHFCRQFKKLTGMTPSQFRGEKRSGG